MILNRFYSFLFLILLSKWSLACDCPFSKLSLDECNKYEIIFRGRVKALTESNSKLSEAIFEISELYKGNAGQKFKVLYDPTETCSQTIVVGQEWIIYSRYKQIDNAKLDWCSRSRRAFNIAKEDFYTLTNGNDYDDELKFLRQNLRLHRFLAESNSQSANRNQLPSLTQSIWIVISSILALVLFYFLFNKFIK